MRLGLGTGDPLTHKTEGGEMDSSNPSLLMFSIRIPAMVRSGRWEWKTVDLRGGGITVM